MNNYAIYNRKSSESEEKQAASIESQSNEMKELAKRIGITPLLTLNEAQSAKYPGRPVFSELLRLIEIGKINAIMTWHPDRLSRNPIDAGSLVDLMDKGKLIEIVTPNQRFTSSVPMDRFMLGFLMLQAKLENDNKGVNVKRGLKTKAEKGVFPSSWTKPGYKWDIFSERGDKKIVIDKTRFNLIRKAWDLFLTGKYSVATIQKLMSDEWGYKTIRRKSVGGNKMARSKLYEIFKDPFYFGEYEYPKGSNMWYQGTHQSMISKDDFERAQIILGKRGFYRKSKKNLPFAGVFQCGECFSAITPDEKNQVICSACKTKFTRNKYDKCKTCKTPIDNMKSPTYLHYIYYRCNHSKNPTCKQRSIELKELEKQLREVLSKIKISERFKNWAIKYINEASKDEIAKRQAIFNSLTSSYDSVCKKLDNLLKLKISENNSSGEMLSDNDFIDQKRALIKDKMELLAKIKTADLKGNRWIDEASSMFSFAVSARQRFVDGDITIRKDILTNLGSNLYILDKKVFIKLQKPLVYIEELKSKVPSIDTILEPKEKIDSSTQLEDSWSRNDDLLRS